MVTVTGPKQYAKNGEVKCNGPESIVRIPMRHPLDLAFVFTANQYVIADKA